MLAIAGSVWALSWPLTRRDDTILRLIVPAILLVGTLVAWQSHAHWTSPLRRETANAMRFLAGSYSLAEAYSHANSPYPFGAINPGALAAAQQLPYGTPIWSTNVDSYCMVPGCLIESVISFKMSGRLDEILGGDPELAKQRLQQAGLNYFLFMKDYRMIDLLAVQQIVRAGDDRPLSRRQMERRLDLPTDLDRAGHDPDRARLPRGLYAPARRTRSRCAGSDSTNLPRLSPRSRRA